MKIHSLKIITPDIGEQSRFYKKVLGLEVFERSRNSFKVKVGFSYLHFLQDIEATPYHIAFHIPAELEALGADWLKQRWEITQNNGKDIVDFPNWNARSVYFRDPADNILEFISRRHCFVPSAQKFMPESILGISEIGLSTRSVSLTYNFLNRNFNLNKFTEFGTSFCAVGNEEGLFIVIDKNQKDWFPTGDKAYASEFDIHFTNEGQKYRLTYKNERLVLL